MRSWKGNMVVEDNPLVAVFAGTRPGRVAAGAAMHHGHTTNLVLIAHKNPGAGQNFTCNPHDVPSDPQGLAAGIIQHATSNMPGLDFEGAATDLPKSLLQYVVNRYDRVGLCAVRV